MINKKDYFLDKYYSSLKTNYSKYYFDIFKGEKEKAEYIIENYINEIKFGNRWVIPRLIIMATDKCTLRCEECAALMTEYRKEKMPDMKK